MTKSKTSLDQVFHALADSTRRSVVERLGTSNSASVSELFRPFDIALPSFVQHLKVLENAGIITTIKEGRVRTCRLAPTALQTIDSWLDEQRSLWTQRLDQLDEYATSLKEKEKAR